MSEIKITGTQPDRVEVTRTWEVEAPDWTPGYKSRTIAPRKVTGVWVNGVLERISVTGPYRLKSGKLAEPKFERDEGHIGGTGSPDYRPAYDRTTFVGHDNDGRVSEYTLRDFPEWVWDFIAEQTTTAEDEF